MSNTLLNTFLKKKTLVFIRNVDSKYKNNLRFIDNEIKDIEVVNDTKNIRKYKATYDNDLYFQIVKNLQDKYDEIHFLKGKCLSSIRKDCCSYIDINSINNEEHKGKVFIWYIPTFRMMSLFKGNTLFLRGDYPCYSKLVDNYKKIILYRAGVLSLKNKYYDNRIDIYLYDDKESIGTKNSFKRFTNKTLLVPFIKPCCNSLFYNKELPREYNILYIAKSNNKTLDTSNHLLFINFLEFLANNKINVPLKILTCGYKLEDEMDTLKKYIGNLGLVELTVYNRVPQKVLTNLMNKSKILLVPTIRDGNPRIISQGIKCGLHIVITDKLDSGKDQLNNNFYKFGTMLNYSLGKDNNSKLTNYNFYKKLIELSLRDFNYKEISDKGAEYFTAKNTVKQFNDLL